MGIVHWTRTHTRLLSNVFYVYKHARIRCLYLLRHYTESVLITSGWRLFYPFKVVRKDCSNYFTVFYPSSFISVSPKIYIFNLVFLVVAKSLSLSLAHIRVIKHAFYHAYIIWSSCLHICVYFYLQSFILKIQILLCSHIYCIRSLLGKVNSNELV